MSKESSRPPKASLLKLLSNAIPTVLVLLLMAGGWIAIHQINRGGTSPDVGPDAVVSAHVASTVSLTGGKLRTGRFKSAPVQAQQLQHMHTVPGRIRYDESKHIDVKAPMDGILTEVKVAPGDLVQPGQLLAVLQSSDIGQARAEILKRQKQRDIAHQLLERETLLAKNLEELSALLSQGKSIESIEQAFNDRMLGNYRQEILAAYSKMQLSSELLSNIEPLAKSGSVSGRVMRERETDRQVAEATFRTARDQATYSANQAKLKAEADLAEAERQLKLAWRDVENLLGYKESSQAPLSDDESLSRLEIRAPMAGSVESRGFAMNERVSRGDSLVVLANTELLFVAASIRESDWPVVELKPGTVVSISVSALQDRVFEGRISYMGREVQSESNSVPLMATIKNDEGLLRPGMFVRVTIPVGETREAISVKPASVVQHENQQFVFVDMTGGKFKRVDVSTGYTSEDWIEVTKGLALGDLVVTNGAFLLKSELLLQGESE